MKTSRSILVTACAASLLALPVAAAAVPHGAGAATQAAHRYATTVRFLDFNHTKGFGSSLTIRGQITIPSLGGAIQGRPVKVYRRLDGRSHWRYLGTKYTSHQVHPRFKFPTAMIGNADYRAVFPGNAKLRRSSRTTAVSVYRHITGQVNKHAQFHGRIAPHYGHRAVYLDRRPCANCGWHRYRSGRTSSRGTYSFKLNAPRHGAYYWRISTPPSTRFIISHSGVFTTRRG